MLYELLMDHEGWELHSTAAAALGTIGDDAELAWLLDRLVLDSDNRVGVTAGLATMAGRGFPVVSELLAMLESEDVERSRVAARALGTVGRRGNRAEETVRALIERLDEEAYDARLVDDAAGALRGMQAAAAPALPALRALLSSDDLGVFSSASEAIHSIEKALAPRDSGGETRRPRPPTPVVRAPTKRSGR